MLPGYIWHYDEFELDPEENDEALETYIEQGRMEFYKDWFGYQAEEYG